MGKKSERANDSKRIRVSQTDVPAYSLDEALRVPKAIHDNYGGHAAKPFDVAAAMELKPGSSHFKMLTGAAIAYGLTDGGYNANEIGLTQLSKQIFRPLEEGADIAAKRAALLKPKVIGDFLKKYNGSPFPKDSIGQNVLIEMGVPAERVKSVLQLLVDSAKGLGFLRDIKGTTYVNLSPPDGFTPIETIEKPVEDGEPEQIDKPEKPSTSISRPANIGQDLTKQKRVFITHGKNQSFIEPIRKLLKFGELEAVVAVERQSVSKPVSDKVMTDMRSCGAAIIHVEDEMRLVDSQANEHIVLNPNVLIEIGAAMALYGKRFILLVKDGVKLPSNLQGLYEVRYSGDTLDGTATIKLLEAINAMKSETET
ncbi:MAG TPA: TIR domain-containing protein [Burkholderiales bacterium]|nr:TIR domain-containing protein [Burkholderiales bacterium]